MEDFNSQAIVILYPDGVIDKTEVTDKSLHLSYYKDIYNKSPRFKKIMDNNNIDLNGITASIRGGYSNLNFLLSEVGIVILQNLRIKEIKRNKIFTQAKPYFLVTLPDELTDEQKTFLNELFTEYDCSKSNYGKLDDYQYKDIEYEKVLELISQRHK